MNEPHNKCLFLTPGLTPATGHGGVVYTRGVMRLLRKSRVFPEIETVNVRGVDKPYAHRAERVVNLFRSMVASAPERVLSSVTREGLRNAAAAAEQGVGALVFDHVELVSMQERLPQAGKRVLICHNIEHLLMRERLAKDRELPGPVKPLLLVDQKKLQRYENESIQGLDGVWCISSDDAAWFRDRAPSLPVVSVPPTFARPEQDRATGGRRSGRALRLGFLGALSWWPNAEAVRWFIAEVLPHLQGRVQLHLYGGAVPDDIAHHPAVRSHGFVPDIDEVWSSIDVFVCPMHSGGGSNVKFAEAVFRGIPTLATRFAARGLPEIRDDSLRYLDAAQEWVEFINSSAMDDFTRGQIAPDQRRVFSDEAQLKHALEFLLGVLGECAPARVVRAGAA